MTRAQWQAGRIIVATIAGLATIAGMLWLREQGDLGRGLALALGGAGWLGLAIWITRSRRGEE
ncbi:hypothetical protein [Streptomyces sp. NPDC048200]|uniref:hypothetical protein n=1 Tax=Streptomyces sp. NPDC048200 TaxID=3365512 RepID=UPI003722E528